ncbi:glutamate racemase [Pendulispora albinea]|uniref:Glutamate racemase n=1 Tax=Pendulispora albinea TaxID=2741071 RepID=A0ABZ2LTR3_9BACT
MEKTSAPVWLALLTLTVYPACAANETAAPAPAAPAAARTPAAPTSAAAVAEPAPAPDKAAPTALIEHIGAGRSKLYPVDRKGYETADYSRLPIGVFDSGIGGLTVFNAILQLDEFNNKTHQPGADGIPDFRDERFIYYGDQANMPYGRYASVGKENFLRELVIEDAAFLLGNRYWPSAQATAPLSDKPMVKAVVVACNTATAYGINDLRAAFEAWKIPMILVGVVEAGSEGAVSSMKQRGDQGAVAVMATVGTCQSNAYPKTIERFSKTNGVQAPKIVQQGSVGLAGAIEGDPAFVRSSAATSAAASATKYQGPAVGNTSASIDPELKSAYGFEASGLAGDPNQVGTWRLNSVENYVRYDVTTLVEAHRKQGASAPISTVVLGCTHFPFQREQIAAQFERLRNYRDASGAQPYQKVVSSHIELVDPAKLTAKQLYVALASKARFRENGKAPVLEQNAFFISRPNASLPEVKLTADGTLEASYKYGRMAGTYDTETVKRVPMRSEDLTPELRALVQKAMPAVWESFQTFQTSRWVTGAKTAAR